MDLQSQYTTASHGSQDNFVSDSGMEAFFSNLTDSQFLAHYAKLESIISARKESATRSIGDSIAFIPDEPNPPPCEWQGHAIIQYMRDHLPLENRFINDSITLLPVDKYPTIELAVPMGSGKTEIIIDTCIANSIQKLIVVSPQRSLIDGTLARFKQKGLPLGDYRVMDFKKGKCDEVAICCNSINKLPHTEAELAEYTLIIDESESVLSQLALMDKVGQTLEGDYDYLRTIIKRAKNVVVADANLGKLTTSKITELRGDKPILRVSSTFLPGAGRTQTIWKDKSLLLKDILKSLAEGYQVIIPSDSATQTELVYKTLTEAGYHGIAIWKDTRSDSQEAAFLANVDEELPKHQFVVHSPALSTGVSISAKPGQRIKVYGFFSSLPGPTPENAWQQLGRYRGLVDYNVHIDNRVQSKPATDEECKKELYTKTFAKTAELTDEDFWNEIHELRNSAERIAFLNKKLETPYTNLQAEVLAKNNGLNNNYLESFIGLAEKQGYTVTFKDADNESELKAARVAMKEMKALVKSDYVDKIMAAPEIDKTEANRIRENEDAKSYDVHALERFEIQKFYGEVTPKIVALDQRGQLRSKIRRVLRIANPAAARESDISDIVDLFNDKVSVGHLRPHKLYSDIYRDMLSWAGYSFIDGELRHDGRIVTGHGLRSSGFIQWVKREAKFIGIFHRLPKDIDEKPVSYLQTFLEDLGLELTFKKLKQGGKVITEYHASEDKLKLIRQFT